MEFKYSLIIPAFNETADLEVTVAMALAADSPPHEIIVVDDHSVRDCLRFQVGHHAGLARGSVHQGRDGVGGRIAQRHTPGGGSSPESRRRPAVT